MGVVSREVDRWRTGGRYSVFIMTTAMLVSAGCGGDARPKPDASAMATVTGSVTNAGKPLAPDSNVVFYCTEKAATAAGKLDSLGKFSLKEGDPNVGIPAGRYQVMIRPPDPPPVQVGTDDYQKRMMSGKSGASMAPMTTPTASEIAQKFQSFETSGIALEVRAGPNNFDIDLSKLSQ